MSQLSYVVGTGETPLLYSDIPNLLDEAAENIPEKAAHVFRFIEEERKGTQELTRTVITFRDLAERSLAVAAAFMDMGFKPGDTIAILGGNCPQYLYVDYACLRIKLLLIRVPVNLCNVEALVKIIARYECKGLVFGHFLATHIGPFIKDFFSENLSEKITEQVKTLKFILSMGKIFNDPDLPSNVIDIDDMISFAGDKAAVKNVQQTIDPEEVSIIMPTSGSTGEPKFAAYTHFNYLHRIKNVLGCMNLAEDDTVYFNDRPFGWIGGNIYASVICRITMVYFDSSSTVGGEAFNLIYKVCDEEKVTGALMLPYLLFDAMKAEKNGEQRPETLKYVFTGGERLSSELINFLSNEFTSVIAYYGSTEMGIPCRGSVSAKGRSTGSLSKFTPFPSHEIKIIDDIGRITARGLPGQILVRSVFGFTRYLRNPVTTEKVKSTDGWISTGDIGSMTSDGLLEIVGRSKDIISRGTTKIYPKFIEDTLLKCPGVQKAIVVGVPDPRLYQELCACIIPVPGHKLDESHLREFYNTQMLGVSCAPRYYQMMTEFPLGNTGKYDRKVLASQAAEKRCLEKSISSFSV